MRTECTCGKVLRDEPAEGGISHGLCPACYRATMTTFLEGYSDDALQRELLEARTGLETAIAGIGAARTIPEIDAAQGVLVEAKEWLALVEIEVEQRGGRT